MSQNFTLEFDTDMNARNAFLKVFEFIGIEAEISLKDNSTKDDPTWFALVNNVYTIAFQEGERYEEHGITTNVTILFHLTIKNYKAEKDLAFNATAGWLKNAQTDTTLRFNDILLLIRKDGELSINSDTEQWEWEPQYLALLPQPYEMVPFKL